MIPGVATLVLVGLSFVAALMASYAAESAAVIVHVLRSSPELLGVGCTYSSVATAPLWIRIAAAVLPIIFVSPVIFEKWKRLQEGGLLGVLALFVGAYGILAKTLVTLPCRAA
jgi:hypothetical protein